ncbi:MAG: hypothetical protein WKH64_11190 [Chloroflexia bacterium]
MPGSDLGLSSSQHRTTLFDYDNKDALIFPELIADPEGRPSIALIHRPDYDLSHPGSPAFYVLPADVTETRPSMWISYCPVEQLTSRLGGLTHYRSHCLLAEPDGPWQALKIGGGSPPLLTQHGWLTLFHGVSGQILDGMDLQPNVHYSAGVLVLDKSNPRKVLYRSKEPVLEPTTPDEREGLVDNVVFPTAVDQRDNGRIDVYYGMADSRIGVGKLQVPAMLPTTAQAAMAV